MNANRSTFFSKLITGTASYAGNKNVLESEMSNLKVSATVADCDINLINADNAKIDITVKVGETLSFEGLKFSNINVKGNTSVVRVWAWK